MTDKRTLKDSASLPSWAWLVCCPGTNLNRSLSWISLIYQTYFISTNFCFISSKYYLLYVQSLSPTWARIVCGTKPVVGQRLAGECGRWACIFLYLYFIRKFLFSFSFWGISHEPETSEIEGMTCTHIPLFIFYQIRLTPCYFLLLFETFL